MTSEISAPVLQRLDPNAGSSFAAPTKRIHNEDDVTVFQASKAYADIMTFIFQLNIAMLPRNKAKEKSSTPSIKEWTLDDSDVGHPPVVQGLAKLIQALSAIIDEAPPDPGPRRFGNISFRKWHGILKDRVSDLLAQYLPPEVMAFKTTSEVPASSELESYFLGGFGSAQRLDFGTGHELSFIAFLGCLWKLGAFPESVDGDQERSIVLGVIEPYLNLIRKLILTYTLEPAGTHGVWGLDDHFFISYILGSAQFSPVFSDAVNIVTEGSLVSAPSPTDVAKAPAVERERRRNMYFSAIGFIYDVKKGPFWEHSPILYDISGVKAGWAKINKGMIKMYNAEVLGKFPVVQHFFFGSLFAWDRDPNAKVPQVSKPSAAQSASQSSMHMPTARPLPGLRDPMADPMATTARATGGMPATTAPWANQRPGISIPMPGPTMRPVPNDSFQTTRAPWATRPPASTHPGAPPG